jgi:hypothetical protein
MKKSINSLKYGKLRGSDYTLRIYRYKKRKRYVVSYSGPNAVVLDKAQDMDYDKGEQNLIQDFEDTFYLQRLDGGLFMLQTVDYILAWAVIEDDGVRHCLFLY